MTNEKTYFGLDLSTQQLKGVIISDSLEILQETQVHFDSELPEFRTHGGIVNLAGSSLVTASPLMWVKALDLLFDKLRICGADFGRVVALSGSAQQHGTVYWKKRAQETLQNLDSDKFLHQQLVGCFSINDSPVWMDSSTTEECKYLENIAGGPEKLAIITGSKGYERFSGPQIAKIFKTKTHAYNNTERISLISSFACSLFLGNYASIDYADASGMNLFDIHKKEWDDSLLQACGSNLSDKLGTTVPSNSILGNIDNYFVKRFGFNKNCKVIAFTGDNPGSLIGMCLGENDIAISLGTSDTLFMWLEKPKILLDGHILCNPIDKNSFMALLCFKNGSLTRNRIRDKCAESSWDTFNELLNSTPRGNFGNMGFYYDQREIIPWAIGDHLFNKANDRILKFNSKEVEVRALIEGQFIAKRAHAEEMGYVLGPNTRIIATGGGSTNKVILQVISDVFNSPVYCIDAKNSAMLGSAYQAKHGLFSNSSSFEEITKNAPQPQVICTPYSDANSIYNPMVERYRKLIKTIS